MFNSTVPGFCLAALACMLITPAEADPSRHFSVRTETAGSTRLALPTHIIDKTGRFLTAFPVWVFTNQNGGKIVQHFRAEEGPDPLGGFWNTGPSSFIRPTAALKAGYPSVVTANFGVVFTSMDSWMLNGFLVEFEAGLNGGGFNAGYAPLAGIVHVNANLYRTWSNHLFKIQPNATYVGLEGEIRAIYAFSVGFLQRISKGESAKNDPGWDNSAFIARVGLGVGF